MTEAIVLRPGAAALADWRAIYRGAPVALDFVARADVEAGRAMLGRGGSPAPVNGNAGETDAPLARPYPPEGEPLPVSIVRLTLALKLASLAQGVSGVRWGVVEHLGKCLALELTPVIRANDRGDAAMLAAFAAGLFGDGEMARNGETRPAAEALAAAGVAPPELEPRERHALASGTQIATALALAGLFEAETILQSALVAGALSGEAMLAPEAALHAGLQRLRRQPGRSECATALRVLLARNQPRPPAAVPEARAGGASVLGAAAEITGACLDLLRQAGDTLQAEANAVADASMLLWQTGERLEAHDDAAAAIALAADTIALTLAHLGAHAHRRAVMLFAAPPPAPRRTRKAASAPIAASLQSTAGSLAAEIRVRAEPASLAVHGDAEQFPATSAALAGAKRLLPLAGNVTLVLAIEMMAAAEALDLAGRKRASDALEPVRTLLRERAPPRGGDAIVAPYLAAVAELLRSGAVAAAAAVSLPSVVRQTPHLGARPKPP